MLSNRQNQLFRQLSALNRSSSINKTFKQNVGVYLKFRSPRKKIVGDKSIEDSEIGIVISSCVSERFHKLSFARCFAVFHTPSPHTFTQGNFANREKRPIVRYSFRYLISRLLNIVENE